MSILNKILAKLGPGIKQESMHWVQNECHIYHWAHRVVRIHLNKTKCTLWSVTLLVPSVSSHILRALYTLFCNCMNDFNPLAVYRITGRSLAILVTTEHNILVPHQPHFVLWYFHYLVPLRYWHTISPTVSLSITRSNPAFSTSPLLRLNITWEQCFRDLNPSWKVEKWNSALWKISSSSCTKRRPLPWLNCNSILTHSSRHAPGDSLTSLSVSLQKAESDCTSC